MLHESPGRLVQGSPKGVTDIIFEAAQLDDVDEACRFVSFHGCFGSGWKDEKTMSMQSKTLLTSKVGLVHLMCWHIAQNKVTFVA
eukprot:3131129-Amphidinium_carterae.1